MNRRAIALWIFVAILFDVLVMAFMDWVARLGLNVGSEVFCG